MTSKPAALLEEGDVFDLTAHHKVYVDIQVKYENRRSPEIAHSLVHVKDHLEFVGEFVVYKTVYEGRVPYRGYHVFAERLTDGLKIDFYQSGGYTAVIPNVKVVRKMVRKWVPAPPSR